MTEAFGTTRDAFRSVSTHFWCACLSVARIFHVPDVGEYCDGIRGLLRHEHGQPQSHALARFDRGDGAAETAQPSRQVEADGNGDIPVVEAGNDRHYRSAA